MVYHDIQDVFRWFGLNFTDWTKRINNIDLELKRTEYVFNHYPSKKYYYFRVKLGILHYKKKYLH